MATFSRYQLKNLLLLILSFAFTGCATSKTPASFQYGVKVQAKDTEKFISDAKVIIDVAGKAPLSEVSDSNGFTRIFIDVDRAGQPAKLIIEADKYKKHTQNIDLNPNSLPTIVQLEPLASIETKPTSTTVAFNTSSPSQTASPSLQLSMTPAQSRKVSPLA